MASTKMDRQIWIRLAEYSSAKVTDPSEVPRINGKLIFLVDEGNQADLRALGNIVLARTSNSLVHKTSFFSYFFKNS